MPPVTGRRAEDAAAAPTPGPSGAVKKATKTRVVKKKVVKKAQPATPGDAPPSLGLLDMMNPAAAAAPAAEQAPPPRPATPSDDGSIGFAADASPDAGHDTPMGDAETPAPAAEAAPLPSHCFPDDADVREDILRLRQERPVSVLEAGGFRRCDSDSDSDSSGVDATESNVNANVLSSFIAKRSEFFVEPEPAVSTRESGESVHAILSDFKKDNPRAPPAPPADDTTPTQDTASPSGLTDDAPGFAPYMGFGSADDAFATEGGVEGESAEKLLADLPMSERAPVWLRGVPQEGGAWRSSRLVSLHWELLRFAQHSRLGKPDKKALRGAGKQGLEMLTAHLQRNLAPPLLQAGSPPLPQGYRVQGELVGSLSTRLARRHASDVNICVFIEAPSGSPADHPLVSCTALRASLAKELEAAGEGAEWAVLEGDARLSGLQSWDAAAPQKGFPEPELGVVALRHIASQCRVVFFVNDINRFTARTADFISGKHTQFKEKLECLVHPVAELIRQRGFKGAPRSHEVALMAISFLNHRAAAGGTEDAGWNLGSLFSDFLAYLVWRFNSYMAVLNPMDATGRVVPKKVLPGAAPKHHLHIIDPVSHRNAAWKCYNWGSVREVLENCLHMMGGQTSDVPDFACSSVASPHAHENACSLHALHPHMLCRPTVLSRLLMSSKLDTVPPAGVNA